MNIDGHPQEAEMEGREKTENTEEQRVTRFWSVMPSQYVGQTAWLWSSELDMSS